jgi:hypothetical protein
VLDLRPEPDEPAPGPAGPAVPPLAAGSPEREPEPRPAVLLITRIADRELDLAGQRLGAAGIPVVRLNAETAGLAGLVIDLDRAAVRISGKWISPTVTWVRHFTARAMPEQPGPVRRVFAGQSWHAIAAQLGAVSGMALPPPGLGLLDQLACARRTGVVAPRTVVTSDPGSARGIIGPGRVIVKSLSGHFVEASPGLLTGVFPQVTDADAADAPGGAIGLPVVVQEYVDHEQEIRAYYVDGAVIAFAIGKDNPAQPWLAPELVTAERIDPPDAISAAVRTLATAMSLHYGAFDFLLADGVPVFLEVNLNGDWCWLETRISAAPVTEAVAGMLARFHRDALARLGDGRADRLDPVRFLTGGRGVLPG